MSDETRGDAWEGQGEMYDEPKSIATVAPPVKTDAAQAKTDAIANLTMKCYERASMLTLSEEETAKLAADFPDEAFRPGAAGKEQLIYIEHAFLRDRLNDVLGPGQWSIIQRSRWTEQNNMAITVYMEAMLVVRGCFVAEAVGDMTYWQNNASTNIGDAIEGAKTQALRRCAKELGIGLQAWKKTWCEGWWARRGNKPETNGSQTHDGESIPPCPKCGKQGRKDNEGTGFYCWRKKGGCGHVWDNTGNPSAPEANGKQESATTSKSDEQKRQEAILAEWDSILDPLTVNADKLNGEIKTKFAKIGGKDPARAKVWTKICKLAETHGYYSNHATKTFVPREPQNV